MFVTQAAEDHTLFPTAVSEEELDEAKKKSNLKSFFISSKIILAPGGGCHKSPEPQGTLIIGSKAAEQWES